MKREKDKVYCKDCIHDMRVSIYCYREYNPYTELTEGEITREHNTGGTCSDYKRKWWKFWVK